MLFHLFEIKLTGFGIRLITRNISLVLYINICILSNGSRESSLRVVHGLTLTGTWISVRIAESICESYIDFVAIG